MKILGGVRFRFGNALSERSGDGRDRPRGVPPHKVETRDTTGSSRHSPKATPRQRSARHLAVVRTPQSENGA